jgi:linoleoyl-CoA desaturase
VKWVFVDDFQCLLQGRIAQQKLNRPSAGELATLLLGKAIFVAWALVIPALLHPLATVVGVYLLVSAVVGVVLAVTFQLAHCVDAAEFPPAMEQSFAAHQVATTVDFARKNPILTWYMGGLNFQVEHHLFPRICHVHYPVLSEIVARVAARHGITYREHITFRAALASHYRHLRALGRPGEVPVAARPEAAPAAALRNAA